MSLAGAEVGTYGAINADDAEGHVALPSCPI